ncbi:hypothetical protein DAPK24_038430 [Pichia kluyveri]|uniref:Methyltransferase type 11 domain-containing protein n=1 Tax=Pichia kluyveri TaxID=36015 RepID=A0AAV5R799_PICKL|nr:hypothetical protein DAPK24_038430 [Pichia kluyveri]
MINRNDHTVDEEADIGLAKITNKRHIFKKLHHRKHKGGNGNDNLSNDNNTPNIHSINMMKDDSRYSQGTMIQRSSTTPVDYMPNYNYNYNYNYNNHPTSPTQSILSSNNSTINTTINSTINNNNNNTRSKLFKFTKKASKFASDIAFGNAFTYDPVNHNPYIPQFNPHKHYEYQHLRNHNNNNNNNNNNNSNDNNNNNNNSNDNNNNTNTNTNTNTLSLINQRQHIKQQLYLKYHTKLRNVITLTKTNSMEFYLDYLRFFLTYMDEAERNDPFIYSNTRNSFWNQWVVKYLIKIRNILEDENNIENNNTIDDTNSLNISNSNEHEYMENNDELKTLNNEIEEIKLKIQNIPTIDQIDKETFQDRRILLLLLWQNQILYNLSNQKQVLTNLLQKQGNNHNTHNNEEICIITTNKIKPFNNKLDESLPKLFKNHLFPSKLELIDGWQLRHDFPNYKTNMINIADRFQTILNLNNTSYLPIDILQQYPHFNDYVFLSEDFVNNKLDSKERDFLTNYSSFIVPSINKLPFRDNSQCLVYTPDFTRLVKNENDIKNSLNEIYRVLKIGGSISLILFDISTFKHSSNLEHNVYLSEYIQIYINFLISKISNMTTITDLILNILREKNFKNIKFTKLGVPVLDYNESLNNNKDNKVHNVVDQQKEHENTSSAINSNESTIPIPIPIPKIKSNNNLNNIQNEEISNNSTIKSNSNSNSNSTLIKSKKNSSNNLISLKLQRSSTKLSDSYTSTRTPNNIQPTNSLGSKPIEQEVDEQENIQESEIDEINETQGEIESSKRNSSLQTISDQPIASMYAMFSSFLDFLRISHVSKLNSWINNPKEYKLPTDEIIEILKIWIDWKLNNFNGEKIHKIIIKRLSENVDNEGYDNELGVRLFNNNSGDVWINNGSLEEIENFYNSWNSSFSDGLIVGLDTLMLVTAEK